MPLVGLGCWKIPNATCAQNVYDAIKVGYRLLDEAADYGNEKEAGEGVRRAIADGLVKREELFITSKLWNTFHAREHVKQSAKLQLQLWGLDYFDLFLIHFPISLTYVDPAHKFPPGWFGDDGKVHLQNTPMSETWAAMEELVDEGLVKNIGLSNTAGVMLLDIIRYARIEPAVLQVERHPYLSQEPLIQLTKELGIAMTAYSSMGPQGYFEIGMGQNAKSLMQQDLVIKIAQAHKASPAQVLLRWSTQRGLAVIPKTDRIDQLQDNLRCNDFDLSEEELSTLGSLDANIRMNNPVEIDPRMAIFA
ncbi:Aldo/keto reductase [Stereum hirsutum FP-91666 SS1]|uniref:Aldo/keto reductase n=1 Tax=Stereum hirsutum (strain FP-91666) TaxID=721885 RepID=UPI0004449371|nr:Aldo/keto reductase [Stereum hirsutum FP-91666 SS1]EIM81959.1 Aldo/keto reductase [Stereum hirsutum FP-91666 SS1]